MKRESISEAEAVQNYRRESEIFKNLQKAVLKTNSAESEQAVKFLQDLQEATTFAQMIKASGSYSLEKESFARQTVVRVACTVGGYFHAGANFAYYATQLKDDIINYAVDNGFGEEQIATLTT